MKTFSKKTLFLSSIALPLALGVQAANAAQITEWGYDVTNSFSNVTATDGNGSVTISGPNDNVLTWGSADQSSVSVTSVSNPPSLFTNGDWVVGGVFTHDNSSIPASDADLASFDLNTSLMLTPLAPEGPEVGPFEVTFDSFFTETFNFADNDECFTGSTSNCDDIFSVGNASELGEIVDGNLLISQDFSVAENNYTLFLRIAGLAQLTDEQCSVAGADAGCVGFLTREDTTNQFTSSFRITSADSPASVPEPGSLALMGLGLLGLGMARHRAKKA